MLLCDLHSVPTGWSATPKTEPRWRVASAVSRVSAPWYGSEVSARVFVAQSFGKTPTEHLPFSDEERKKWASYVTKIP
jgi:hypothetical protein